MDDSFLRSEMQARMESQDRRIQPRIVFNDNDVTSFRRILSYYMAGDYSSAMLEMNGLKSRGYTDVVHINLNDLVLKFYASRCIEAEVLITDLREAMMKAYGPMFETSKERDLTQVGYLYNYALISFYLMRYNQALAIMNAVMRYAETLEDGLVRDCCFLLLELHIRLFQVNEALQVISYLEDDFDEATGLRIKLPDNYHTDSLLFDENCQLFRPAITFKAKLQLYKLRVVNMLWNQNQSKKESRGLLSTQGTNPVSLYLKSQSEYNRGNYSKAMKALNHTAPNANAASSVLSGDCLPSLYYNNMACIHSAMGKNTIATVYFNLALEENTKAMQALQMNGKVDYGQMPLQCVQASRFAELVYNLGTQLLVSGQPAQAFPLLVEASHRYHQNPRLWLRLAESCIAKHKNDLIDPLHRRKPTRYMIKGSIGAGKYRKLLLSSVLLPYQKQLAQRKVQPQTEAKKDPSEPALTIEFARMCLINALATVNRHLARGSGLPMEDVYAIAPSGMTSKQEIMTLKAYILVNLAFVSNSLWDFVGGIEYSRQAESIPELPGVMKFLISAYASEGFMRLNRLNDAGHYLSVSNINNIFRQMNTDLEKDGQVNMTRSQAASHESAASPAGTRSSEESVNDEQGKIYEQPEAVIKSFLHIPNDYLRKRPVFARNLLGYNHAVWLAMTGDLEAGYEIAEKLRSAETNADSITRARATQLCIYIRFRQENRTEALKLILDECPEWKDRLYKDFDEDEKKLRALREQQGVPWILEG
ncbi:CCR4-NOT transcription complex subunit 10-like [Paramacrobiotus metropolitanus]|uniref:CCR4-NOT transcription complex subunit 10-like n=1 Tax=Paramacrobiotus metropolitanus TaxID=2943436 RepID=UPI002445E4DC|nr:CCR4-NOT transcription complex subunit 10-like [Paramacrobiotus metropolitanus]